MWSAGLRQCEIQKIFNDGAVIFEAITTGGRLTGQRRFGLIWKELSAWTPPKITSRSLINRSLRRMVLNGDAVEDGGRPKKYKVNLANYAKRNALAILKKSVANATYESVVGNREFLLIYSKQWVSSNEIIDPKTASKPPWTHKGIDRTYKIAQEIFAPAIDDFFNAPNLQEDFQKYVNLELSGERGYTVSLPVIYIDLTSIFMIRIIYEVMTRKKIGGENNS